MALVFRNLQEQVQKNKDDIEELKTVSQLLNAFGIKAVGQIDTPELLPNPEIYSGEYGDAYLVGTETPFDFYIFTRPNPSYPTPHWVNIGQFPLAGPQGEVGPEGPQGEQGNPGPGWTVAESNPTTAEGFEPGSAWLNKSTYDIFSLGQDLVWNRVGNIKGATGSQGPQGIQGPTGAKGDKGDVGQQGEPGRVFHIVAQLPNTSDLPDPTTVVDSTAAYLIGESAPYELYVIIGQPQDSQEWLNTGSLTGGSKVYVGGQLVESFNADNKLDKVTGTSAYPEAYIKLINGNQTTKIVTDANVGDSIMLRLPNGTTNVANPISDTNAANKKYVDDGLAGKLDKVTEVTNQHMVYYKTNDGRQSLQPMSPTNYEYTIPYRDGTGNFQVSSPIGDSYVANKKYVDNAVASANITQIVLTSGSTQGTLTQSQVLSLINSPNLTVLVLDGEIYRVSDYQVEMGYIIASHTGHDATNKYFTKTITVTTSTYGWVSSSIGLANTEKLNYSNLFKFEIEPTNVNRFIVSKNGSIINVYMNLDYTGQNIGAGEVFMKSKYSYRYGYDIVAIARSTSINILVLEFNHNMYMRSQLTGVIEASFSIDLNYVYSIPL